MIINMKKIKKSEESARFQQRALHQRGHSGNSSFEGKNSCEREITNWGKISRLFFLHKQAIKFVSSCKNAQHRIWCGFALFNLPSTKSKKVERRKGKKKENTLGYYVRRLFQAQIFFTSIRTLLTLVTLLCVISYSFLLSLVMSTSLSLSHYSFVCVLLH